MISPKQQEVIDILKTQDSMTASEIAYELGAEIKATGAHLRRLEDAGHIYVCEWKKGKYGVPTKAYRFGRGESVVFVAKKKSQDAKRKAFTKRKEYDPYAPIMPNNGWVSTIHSKDYSFQHGDHIRFMERFQPHPDPASAWLFTEIA